MVRSIIVLVAFVACGIAPHAAGASAARGPAPAPLQVADDDASKNTATAAATKSGGTIDGLVTAIDYRSSTMSVTAGSRKVDVTILPSTNIQGPSSSFRTIADITKGSHVRVLLSQRAGLFTAQIITLR